MEQLADTVFSPVLQRVPIAVDSLVKDLTVHPTVYAMSFVHARVPAFGTSLRAISFYGEDLADASLFRESASLMNFYTCGLRSVNGGGEIVRLGSDGTISFYMRGSEDVQAVEEALHFLRSHGYLKEPNTARRH